MGNSEKPQANSKITTDTPSLMTVAEVASYLRVTRKTIYRLLKDKGIPATRVGQQWRFDRALIDQWLERNAVGAGGKVPAIDNEEETSASIQ